MESALLSNHGFCLMTWDLIPFLPRSKSWYYVDLATDAYVDIKGVNRTGRLPHTTTQPSADNFRDSRRYLLPCKVTASSTVGFVCLSTASKTCLPLKASTSFRLLGHLPATFRGHRHPRTDLPDTLNVGSLSWRRGDGHRLPRVRSSVICSRPLSHQNQLQPTFRIASANALSVLCSAPMRNTKTDVIPGTGLPESPNIPQSAPLLGPGFQSPSLCSRRHLRIPSSGASQGIARQSGAEIGRGDASSALARLCLIAVGENYISHACVPLPVGRDMRLQLSWSL
jgi:hypothetical protein